MKARVWVEHEVEVSAADAIAALIDLPEPEQLQPAISGINTCYSFMKRVPATVIAQMNDRQRKIIGEALAVEAARYTVAQSAADSAGVEK